jgi:tryptophan synthase alpha chain
LPENLEKFITRVRKQTSKPLCIGFGISTAEQAQQLARIADGVIVGSKIIQLIESDSSLTELGDFTRQLRNALNHTD